MGCKHAKLVPEDSSPHDLHVNTVLDAASLKNRAKQQKSGSSNGVGGGKTGHSSASGKSDKKQQQQQQLAATVGQKRTVQQDDDDPYSRSNRKVSRYQAKFDTRVMAKYDIKALIGRGSFSRVVRVEHRVTRQPYAIKMVDRVRGVEVCQSELNVLRRVKHAYIIQLVEVFETKDKVNTFRLCLATDCMDSLSPPVASLCSDLCY